MSAIDLISTSGDNLHPVVLQSDSRPVSQQALSGLKISAGLIAVAIVSLVVMRLIPVRRIEANYWHWRHGASIDVGGHRFPVPKQWYVDYLSGGDVMLIDLNSSDIILVRVSSKSGNSTLATWEELVSRPVSGGKSKTLGRKELQVSGETIVCVERILDIKPVPLYPIECRSESAVEVTFQPYLLSSKNHDEMFYSLLQKVQKL